MSTAFPFTTYDCPAAARVEAQKRMRRSSVEFLWLLLTREFIRAGGHIASPPNGGSSMRPTATESGLSWIAAPAKPVRPRDARQLIDELERLHPLIRAHSRAVAVIAGRLARALGADGADEATVRLAGSVHDVGKLTIPRTVLDKPGALTRSEWELVRRHPVEGERLLRPMFGDRPTVLAAVRWHHERWDGRGYPDGLPATRAPLGARIIAVADAFQAMLEARPYRRQCTVDHALDELEAHAGTQFDPKCVRALRDTLRS